MWSDAREEMRRRLQKWQSVGLAADHDTLLRCISAVLDNSYNHENLPKKTISEIQGALSLTATAINILLNTTETYLGMEPDKVYNTKQALPILVKYLVNNDNCFPDDTIKAQMLHWYVFSSTWGHFSGATPNLIDRDLLALKSDNPIDALNENLRQRVGERKVEAENFNVSRSSKRFYSLLRIMSLAGDAQDWGTGKRLPDHSDSPDDKLEWHHIFPKRVLRDAGVNDKLANNLGNLALQTRKTNRAIKDSEPAEYMPTVAEHHPGALESQWVPNEQDLWSVDKYREFLAERHRLLAEAANAFLHSLHSGVLPTPVERAVSTSTDEDNAILDVLSAFVVENGLPPGEFGYEIVDPVTNELVATLDLAWPNGLQAGLSDPIAVLVHEDNQVRKAANDAGFTRLFAGEDAREDFPRYVKSDILGEIAEE